MCASYRAVQKKTYMPTTVSACGDSNEPGLANHEETKALINLYPVVSHEPSQAPSPELPRQDHTTKYSSLPIIVLRNDNTTIVPRTV